MRYSRTVIALMATVSIAVASTAVGAQDKPAVDPIEEVGSAVKGLFNFIGNTLGSMVDQRGRELQVLVEAGDFEGAATYYTKNEKQLESSQVAEGLLPKIAQGLNLKLATSASSVADRLSGMSIPGSTEQWQEAKALIAEAKGILDRYDAVPLLRKEKLRDPSIVRMSTELAAVGNRLDAAASTAFVAYDHASELLFFDAYPISIAVDQRPRIVLQGAREWIAALVRGSELQARNLAKGYGPYLETQEARTLLSSAYAESFARRRNWVGARTFAQTVELMAALEEAGLDARAISRNIRLVIVRGVQSSSRNVDWRADVSGIKVEEIQFQQINTWLKSLVSSGPDEIVILLDPARIMVHQGAASVIATASQRVVGQRTAPNPDWDSARNELDSARRDLQEVERLDQQNQQQAQSLMRQSGGSGFGAVGAIFGSSVSSYALVSARNRVSQAESDFQSKPRTINQPVTQAYKFAITRLEVVKLHEVGVYVIEPGKSRFRKHVVSGAISEAADFGFGVDSRDPQHSKVEASNEVAKKKLLDFAQGGLPVNFGAVWKQLAAAGSEGGVESALPSLPKFIGDDAKRWEERSKVEIRRRTTLNSDTEKEMQRIVSSGGG